MDGCLLLAVLCLGTGAGCEKLGEALGTIEESCNNQIGYYCDVIREGYYDSHTGNFIPPTYGCVEQEEIIKTLYCKSKTNKLKDIHSQLSCKDCNDSKCEDCPGEYLPSD